MNQSIDVPPLTARPRIAARWVPDPRTAGFFGRDEEVAEIVHLLADPRAQVGVLLAGPSGIGKTRLAEESINRLARTNSIVRLSSTPVGDTATQNPGGAARHFQSGSVRQILTHAGGRQRIIVADDAHLLNIETAQLLVEMAHRRQARLLLTINTDEPSHSTVTALWKDDLVYRLEVTPLGTHATRRLASAMLNNRLDASGTIRLSDMSAGNPLLLRELVRAAINQDILTLSAGQWTLGESVPESIPLYHLYKEQISELGGPALRALELIALAEPIALIAVERIVADKDLLTLEEKGLITVESKTGAGDLTHPHRPDVAIYVRNPLIGHVVRQGLTWLRRRDRLRALISIAAPTGISAQHDQVRITGWRLDIGERPAHADLMDSARHAYHVQDLKVAARLSGAAWCQYRSVEAAILHATSLISLSDFEQARAVLDDARRVHPTESGQLDLTLVRGLVLQGRTNEAQEILTRTDRPEAQIYGAMVSYFEGRFEHTLAQCESLSQANEPALRIEAALFQMAALCHAGRPLDALELYQHIQDGSIAEIGTFALHEGALEEIHAGALHCAGRSQEALELLGGEHERALSKNRIRADARWGLALGFVLLETGRPRQALAHFALTPSNFVGWELWHRKATVYRTLAQACFPEAEAIEQSAAQLPPVAPSNYLAHHLAARAWAASSRADHATAVDLLIQAADTSLSHGGYGDIAVAVHEMARLGLADHTKPYWDIPVQGPFLQARLDYARALAAKDPALLAQAAKAFAAAGANLYAAEAFAELSRLHRRRSEERAATAAALRARELGGSCEGALTHPLHALDEVEPLTAREREISLLAARGLSDKEIADRLTLSTRTVGNHLYRIYAKLGVTSRRELRQHAVQ